MLTRSVILYYIELIPNAKNTTIFFMFYNSAKLKYENISGKNLCDSK